MIKFLIKSTIKNVGVFFNVILLILIFISSFCGLDTSDESFYLLGYKYAKTDILTVNYPTPVKHFLYKSLFSYFNFSVIGVRLLRLFLTTIASLVFYKGIQRFFSIEIKKEKILLFNIVLSGMLLSFSFGPLSLSYNSISSILYAFIFGFWLISKTVKNNYKNACFFFIGIASTFIFFTKPPNIVLLFFLFLYDIFYSSKKNIFKNFLFYFSGVFIALLILCKKITLISQTVNEILQEMIFFANSQDHSLYFVLNKYIFNVWDISFSLKYHIIVLLVVFFFLRKNEKNIKLIKTTYFLVFALFFLDILINHYYWVLNGTRTFYINLYVLIYIITISLQQLLNKKHYTLLLLILTIIPILGCLGTNNGLSNQLLLYGVFYFVLIFLSIPRTNNLSLKYIITNITVFICTIQVSSSIIYYPYRQSNLLKCDKEIKLNSSFFHLNVGSQIFSLKENLNFLKEVKSRYVFTYSHLSGLTLLLNKAPYTLFWLEESYKDKICNEIKRTLIKPEDIIFLIPQEFPLKKEVLDCMSNNNIKFNEDYSPVKKIKYYDYSYKKELTLIVYLHTKNL